MDDDSFGPIDRLMESPGRHITQGWLTAKQCRQLLYSEIGGRGDLSNGKPAREVFGQAMAAAFARYGARFRRRYRGGHGTPQMTVANVIERQSTWAPWMPLPNVDPGGHQAPRAQNENDLHAVSVEDL